MNPEEMSAEQVKAALYGGDPDDWVPRGEGKAGGWTRIGRWDYAHRRSTWARVETIEGPPHYCWVRHEYTAVELCSGREGDDAFARVERGDPAFDSLLDVVMYSIGNIDDSDSAPTGSGER